MKFIVSSFGTLAVLGAVMAQAASDLPACGQTCISNLLGQAPAFGCTAGGDGEAACLCGNATFTYGIRDCSNEACGATDAPAVINYGIAYCSSAGVSIPTTIQTVTSGTIVPSSTGTGSGGAGGGSSETGSAITTSSFVSTLTSDGTTLTTSGATTIFAGAGGSATDSAGSSATSASGAISSALSSISSSAGSAVSSASSRASSAASSATATGSDTASSSAFAPRMTAAPVGFLAAAGVAAMLL